MKVLAVSDIDIEVGGLKLENKNNVEFYKMFSLLEPKTLG